MSPTGPNPDEGVQDVIHNVDVGNGQIVHIQGPADATPEELQQAYQASQQPQTPQYTAGSDAPTLVQADRLNDTDEAALRQLYHTGSADQIAAFLHQRGRSSDYRELADYLAKRDHGGAVSDNLSYAGKPVEDTAGGAFLRGADQGLTLGLGDEAHGFLNGVTSLLKGGSYTDAYNKTVDSERALLGQDSRNNALSSIAGNFVGGAVLPFGLAKAGLTPTMEAVALKAGQEAVAAGATADAAKVIAARAVARRMALEGTAYGGVYGGGSAEGGAGERLTGAAIGAGEGALGGAALGALGVRSATKAVDAANAAPTAGQEVYQAGQRQGIDVLPADVGGPATRRLTAAAAQAPLSASPVITAAQNMVGQAQTARDRIAGVIGQALDPEGAGLAIRSGARKYIASSGMDVSNAYTAAEKAAGDTKITPTNAITALDRHIAELKETPGGAPGLSYMQGLRDSLSPVADEAIDLSKSGSAMVGGTDLTYSIRPNSNNVSLSLIRTPSDLRGSGSAKNAINQLLRQADEKGMTVSLTPDPVGSGGLNKAQLTAWYKSLGFKNNSGRSKDFAISDSMVRQPNASMVSKVSPSQVSVSGLLRMRSVMRDQFMQDGLRGSDTERRVGQVLDAAQTDIADGLRDAGKPQAAALYAAAAAKYKARVNTIDNVLKPLIGTREAPRSGEAVVKTLTADLQGNQARAVKLLRTLPPEEQATTQASIIGALGNQGAGAQNAAGNGFSLNQFLTHWNKIGETAKSAYFGTESRAALNDLARVADGAKQAQGYANRSNTAGGVWGNIGALAGGAAVSPIAAAIGGITQYAGGRLLASPRFARWLARAPRTALSDTSYIERLTRIARAEPAIAGEIGQFQQRLTDALSSASNRAAAQQSSPNMSVTNGQDAKQQPEYQGTAP